MPSPIAQFVEKMMARMDPDHSGTIDNDEIAYYLANVKAPPAAHPSRTIRSTKTSPR